MLIPSKDGVIVKFVAISLNEDPAHEVPPANSCMNISNRGHRQEQ